MKYFYYLSQYPGDSDVLVRIKARRKPGPHTQHRSGTWVISELEDGKWVMPGCPEVTLGTLARCKYVGSMEAK